MTQFDLYFLFKPEVKVEYLKQIISQQPQEVICQYLCSGAPDRSHETIYNIYIQYNQQFCIQIWQISQSFLYKMIEDTLKEGKV